MDVSMGLLGLWFLGVQFCLCSRLGGVCYQFST